MMEKMIFGRYVPGDSFIHHMDPRSKLIFVFAYICIVFIANNTITYGILAVFTILIIFISKVSLRFFLNGLKPILWLVLFTLILQIFFNREGHLVYHLGIVKIYSEGIRQGIFISVRFLLLIFLTSLLTLTTTPISLTDGIEALLNPLKKIKFPVHELALMMSISLRFIPTLMDETEKIMKAQMARGVEFSSGSMTNRIKSIIPLLIPLFVSSFKRAEELATAMEARGYQGGEGRTKYRILIWKFRDTLALLSLVLVTILLVIFRA
ncbi:energy-coupling factor transporter transmembrane component T family protein [Heyndrickxia ginsengihumi]|uniref:Energy-coupling factor transporter transmembrane protein EcfT n=1 Tax=Heyndrickxia ginsengihumi TaxID=363870 RepID=A0A0A6VBV0_9BACI|nr:energy-coupling factor transporter transmembrane protein EcfT [Heyndrickxia ginsengihumi]KHD85710.1 cobalt ABC transporter permease [Heyndrickxia ginsengihumi]MBE6184353.1 energy-coupling factor transporter transmembrane protein EcfT [Bacillus sp. (in: firmicutes)]MCM3024264.1 energy-coupling factor transporter transmembrane protein EcfT [Heyndrickxia ginsengihumi]NEY20915.1 energy-coupling factor transporter transmembrane protein EcfT [Heyndrickxia ginsengihumi]